MTDEEYMKATKDGNVPMSKEEVEQLLAEREAHKDRPKPKTLEERVSALEEIAKEMK